MEANDAPGLRRGGSGVKEAKRGEGRGDFIDDVDDTRRSRMAEGLRRKGREGTTVEDMLGASACARGEEGRGKSRRVVS